VMTSAYRSPADPGAAMHNNNSDMNSVRITAFFTLARGPTPAR
jgi:hypothetical protein